MAATLDPQVFDKAADLLEDKGWTRGTYCKNGRHCALGALAAALVGPDGEAFVRDPDAQGGLGLTDDTVMGVSWAGDELATTLSLGGNWEVPDWNDDPKRKRGQVVKALRDTAERLRGD